MHSRLDLENKQIAKQNSINGILKRHYFARCERTRAMEWTDRGLLVELWMDQIQRR